MRIAFTRWRSGGLFNRPSPRKRLLPKKKTSSGFEFVSALADGASAMPAKWSRPVFSFRFYEGKISRALGMDDGAERHYTEECQTPVVFIRSPRRQALVASLEPRGRAPRPTPAATASFSRGGHAGLSFPLAPRPIGRK